MRTRTSRLLTAAVFVLSACLSLFVAWWFACEAVEYPVHVVPVVGFTVFALFLWACAERAWRKQ